VSGWRPLVVGGAFLLQAQIKLRASNNKSHRNFNIIWKNIPEGHRIVNSPSNGLIKGYLTTSKRGFHQHIRTENEVK
jgi:hypothetical protein